MSGFLSRTNTWKFLSFTLMGILAIGYLIPSALGEHRPGPQEIWEAIDGLQQQINSIEVTPGPQGEPGADGQDGSDGQDGLSCWDLNGDGIGDAEEDVNADGNLDALDCKGEKGDTGATGAPGIDGTDGQDGLNCWDLNGDGVKDDSEDVNNDGEHDAQDCRGPQGEPGPAGSGDVSALEARLEAIENLAVVMNTPPTVDAGPDQTVLAFAGPSSFFCAAADLSGTTFDDGLPNPSLVLSWYKGSTLIANTPTVTVTTNELGINTYTFIADDGVYRSSDSVDVTCVFS